MDRHNDIIKNKAFLDFETCGRSHVIESNEVEARRIKIRIRKEQDCNFVFEGEKVCYKVVICNDSCMDLHDLVFRDRLDDDVEYEKNSFEVNGEKKHIDLRGRMLSYHIHELKEKEELVITFKVEV